eukprot:9504079-Pyramimonas_sp.AAC.1
MPLVTVNPGDPAAPACTRMHNQSPVTPRAPVSLPRHPRPRDAATPSWVGLDTDIYGDRKEWVGELNFRATRWLDKVLTVHFTVSVLCHFVFVFYAPSAASADTL